MRLTPPTKNHAGLQMFFFFLENECQTVHYVHLVMERPKNAICFLGLRIFQQIIRVIHAKTQHSASAYGTGSRRAKVIT